MISRNTPEARTSSPVDHPTVRLVMARLRAEGITERSINLLSFFPPTGDSIVEGKVRQSRRSQSVGAAGWAVPARYLREVGGLESWHHTWPTEAGFIVAAFEAGVGKGG